MHTGEGTTSGPRIAQRVVEILLIGRPLTPSHFCCSAVAKSQYDIVYFVGVLVVTPAIVLT